MRLCPIFEWSQRRPHHLALLTETDSISYLAFDRLIQSECHFIQSLNLPPQSPLPFIAHNTLECVCFFFAAWRMKMIACPLSFRHPKQALASILQQLGVDHLILPQNSVGTTKNVEIDESLLATMLLTSGTTGKPKIALHRLSHHFESAKAAILPLKLEPDDRYQSSLPLFHIGGIALLVRTFLAGSTLVLSDKHEATHYSLVPTQLFRLIQKKTIFPHKCILLGGAPITPALYEQAMNLNIQLYLTYGMTETSSMITLKSPKDPLYSLGQVLEHLELKIQNDGELWVRGKSLFEGYLHHPSLLADSWFATGDRGQLTNEGTLHFLGRKDRLFISGGENIQPEEIEEAIVSAFKVAQAIVLPFSDAEFGMRPAAYLYDPEHTITLEMLQQKLRTMLPGFKIPQKLFPLSRLYKKEEIKSLQENLML